MEHRERTIAALSHRQPDRPPVYVSLTPQVAQMLCRHLGFSYEEPVDAMESSRISHMGLLTSMGVDIVAIAPTVPSDSPTIILPDGRIRNEWGMIFRNEDWTATSRDERQDYPARKYFRHRSSCSA